MKLPSTLQRHFVNLSLTVQSLITDIVLHIEGMPTRDDRSDQAKISQAARAQRANERIADQLKDFVQSQKMDSTDAAIAVSASNGRTTGEIADFIGVDKTYVMRRLCVLKKQSSKWHPEAAPADYYEGGEVLELFAEAQRR